MYELEFVDITAATNTTNSPASTSQRQKDRVFPRSPLPLTTISAAVEENHQQPPVRPEQIIGSGQIFPSQDNYETTLLLSNIVSVTAVAAVVMGAKGQTTCVYYSRLERTW